MKTMTPEHKARENKVRCKLADLTAEVHGLNWAINYAMHTDVTIEKAIKFLKSINQWEDK